MNSMVKKYDLLNGVSNSLLDLQYDNCELKCDINRLICLINKKYKRDINIKIYFEKILGGNPYYVNNEQLKKCSLLLQKFILMELDCMGSKIAENIVELLHKGLINKGKEEYCDDKLIDVRNVFHEYELESLLNTTLSNNIYFLSFRGGDRNLLPFDCEFDIQVKAFKDISTDSIILTLKENAEKFGAELKIL